MSGDLLIRGGRLIDPGSGVDAMLDVLIREGRVAAVGADLGGVDAPVLEAVGRIVAPGFVDLHTHVREPGQEYKETVASGMAAAARGGFTTICAMPNTEPAMDGPPVVAQVQEAARGGPARVLCVGAVTRGRAGERLAELAELRDAGVVAFSDDGDAIASGTLARRAFEYASDLGLPIAEHCEDPALAEGGVMHEGVVSTRLGLRGQGALAEVSIVERDLRLAEAAGARLHICHISARESCEAVAEAKARGVAVTAEVTPHHLLLTDAAVAGPNGAAAAASPGGLRYDTNAKVNPPLRSGEHVAACLEALRAGVIDAVATDHAPHTVTDKQCEFDRAAFGISALETAWGVLGALIAWGELPLDMAIERLTWGPARAWDLDRVVPGLGRLAVGSPGDVAVLDPSSRWTVEPERFASKGKNTPLAGMDLVGSVVATVSGGRVVWGEGAS
ncbi:MAG: dihydroorotase [Chloroflexi bacterium]|nr:dihydroorotase [Chloroflexota bacterium]